MKMKNNYIILLLGIFTLLGCKEDDFKDPDYKQFSLSLSEIVEDGGVVTNGFEIQTTKETMWRITPINLDWMKFPVLRGKGSTRVEYTLEESLELEERGGELLIEAFCYGEPYFKQTIPVKQMPQAPYVYISDQVKDQFKDIDAYGIKELSFDVYSNVSWKVMAVTSETDETPVDWILLKNNVGDKRQSVSFDVEVNAMEEVRRAFIKIFSEEYELVKYVEVTQKKLDIQVLDDVRFIVEGMVNYIPAGTGKLQLKRLLDDTQIELMTNVTVDANQTVFDLQHSIQSLQFELLSYTDDSGKIYPLGTIVDVRGDNKDITTPRWDTNFKRFGGSSVEAPLLLESAEELRKLATVVNAGDTYSGVFVKLNNPVNLGSANWTPIGTLSNPFMGSFDGALQEISGLKLVPKAKCNGLFGVIQGMSLQNVASINNVILRGKKDGSYDVTGNYLSTGSVVGLIVDNAKVKGCTSDLYMKLGSFCGGIVGTMGTSGGEQYPQLPSIDRLNVLIEDCHNEGDIDLIGTTTTPPAFNVGGVVGVNMGVVKSCSNTGNIKLPTNRFIQLGGVVGINLGEVRECYNTGKLQGTGQVGGIVGFGAGTCAHSIIDCYNTGDILSDANTSGGIIGAVANNANAHATIINCYNTGGKDPLAGGIIGGLNKNPKFVIRFCATIHQKQVGLEQNQNDLSGDTMPLDRGDRMATFTKEQMKQQMTFTLNVWSSTTAKWDFVNVWTINEGRSTPYLKNNKQVLPPTFE